MSDAPGPPTLHHLNNSQSQRVLWLLEELKIPYNLVTHLRDPITMLAPPSLHAVTPRGKSPTLVTADGEFIVESSAIIAYLIRTYDTSHIFRGTAPSAQDPVIRDEVLTSFISASLEPYLMTKIFVLVGALADNTHGHFLEPRIASALEYLEAQLGDREYFMGTSPRRVDFMLSWGLDETVQAGLGELPEGLKAWRKRVLAREGWKRALEKPGFAYDLTQWFVKQ